MTCQIFVYTLYTTAMSGDAQLRIGELARRTGVPTELLRAWERRYGLVAPTRTPAGYRLYSSGDVRRVGRMRELLASGLSAAEAARATLAEPESETTAGVEPALAAASLRAAIERLDDAAAHLAFDRLLADFSLDTVLEGVLLPLLHELGEGWARGEISVAQEHFASNLVRGRVLALARGWDRGSGPRAVLACPPGERHDLGLLIFGLALREHGWRITFLGADTPLDTIGETVRQLAPAALVLAVTDPALLDPVAAELHELAADTTVWLGGAGARETTDALLLDMSPLAAAARVALA
jgi:MerR family transcriptional regulator, light-induced transcriptional regulator